MGFGGSYGVYHAMQDNFYWMEHFGDPTFQYHVAMAQIWGILALRLANADVLPFDYAEYAKELLTHLKVLQNGHTDSVIASENPERLRQLLTGWETAADSLHNALTLRLNAGDLSAMEKVNRGLYQLEQRLTSEAGLPLRPWFKHLIYAPGLNSGYAAVVFPGMQDALEMNNEAQVQLQVDRLAETFQRMIEGLEELRSGLSP